MAENGGLYGSLAAWWPVLSPPGDYREEAADIARVLAQAARPVTEVLELGSGGGNNASHLREWFGMTLVDLSPEMLAVSRSLNPGVRHVAGDMREVRLKSDFDAVIVHDAIDYMLTEADVLSTCVTAWAHCRPGGLVMLMPDYTSETFEPSTDHGGSDAAGGRSARYLEWSRGPAPGKPWIETEYLFILREADGTTEVHHDTHRTGLFPRAVWLNTLTAAGFEAVAVREVTNDDREPREYFVGRRPTNGGEGQAGD